MIYDKKFSHVVAALDQSNPSCHCDILTWCYICHTKLESLHQKHCVSEVQTYNASNI